MSSKRITGPQQEPITLAEAKLHLRVTHNQEDAMITAMIAEARAYCENITGRALMPQTWQKTYDNFPQAIELAVRPVISVESVSYTDDSNTLQTLTPHSYQLDNASNDRPAWVVPAIGYAWPVTSHSINSVIITYRAGYASAAEVPEALRRWMLLQIGTWYGSREAIAAGGTFAKLPFIDGLLDRYKTWDL